MIQFIETIDQGIFNRMQVCLVEINDDEKHRDAVVSMAGLSRFRVAKEESIALAQSIRTMPGICDCQDVLINLVQVSRIKFKAGNLTVFFADGTNFQKSGKRADEIYNEILKLKKAYDDQMQIMTEIMRQQQQQQNLVQPAFGSVQDLRDRITRKQ